jgi:parallel beta-helix repeat protein
MISPRLATLLPLTLLAAGCPPKDDTAKPDDTGDSDPETHYDEGCITVDGAGGYAWLNDAIKLAAPGATIEVCAGDFEEAVVVDKAVAIVGAGVGQTRWSAPANEPAFLFQDVEGASLAGMDIASTRSGIEVNASTDVTLSALGFTAIPNYAIDGDGTFGLTIEDCTFDQSQWGAIRVDGGSAAVTECGFTDNLGFAIKGTGGADIDATGNDIAGTMYTELEPDGSIADGFAIFMDEGGQLTMADNALHDNPILSVFAVSGGDVSLSNDSLAGGLYGVYQIYGNLTLQGVAITDPTEMGVLYAGPSGERILLEGSTISGDPEVVSNYAWDEDVLGSIGLYCEADDIEIRDTTIQGYNDFGGYLQPSGSAGILTLENVVFEGNGRRGLFSIGLDASATNVTVTGVRELDDDDYGGAIYVDLPAGWYHGDGSLSLTGGTFTDNAGWGLTAAGAAVEVRGVTFEGNGRSGYMDFSSSSLVEGNIFTGSVEGGSFGTLCAYQSNGIVVRDNLFSDNDLGNMISSFEDGHGNEYLYIYYGEGMDIFGYDSSSVTIEGNTFQEGDRGISLANCSATVSDNTFSAYRDSIIYSYADADQLVRVERTTVEGYGGYLVSGAYGRMEISDLTGSGGTTSDTRYEFYYNGKLQSSASYTSTYDATYFYQCDVVMEDVTIADAPADGLYSYDSALELDNVTIRNASSLTTWSYGANLYWYGQPVVLYADGLTIEDQPAGYGMYVYNSTPANFTGAELWDVHVLDSPSCAINLQNIGLETDPLRFQGLEVTSAGGQGLCLYSSYVAVSDGMLTDNTGGVLMSAGTLAVDASQVTGNHGPGLVTAGGTFSLTGSTVAGNEDDGLQLNGTTATLQGNAITGNTGYGIVCNGAAVSLCEENDLSGNTLGEVDGCGDICGGGTGTGDTGTGTGGGDTGTPPPGDDTGS